MRELSQEKKISDKHVKGKGYETIAKLLDIPLTTVAQTSWTGANLPGCGCRRKFEDKFEEGDNKIARKSIQIN